MVVAKPTAVPSTITCTRLFASAVPEKLKVLSLVMASVDEAPVSVETLRTSGNAGAVVSTVSVKTAPNAEVLPAKSVALAVSK